MEDKEKKSKVREILTGFGLVMYIVGVMLLLTLLLTGLQTGYENTGSLWFYFSRLLLLENFLIPLTLCGVLSGALVMARMEKEEMDYRRYVKAILLLFVVTSILSSCFRVSGRFEHVKRNGKRPLKLIYEAAVLQDAFMGITEFTVLQQEDVSLFSREYRAGTARGGSRPSRYYYLGYHTEDGKEYVCSLLYSQYRALGILTEVEDSITLEYYAHSGILKSVQGIPLLDGGEITAVALEKKRELEEAWAQQVKATEEREKRNKEQETQKTTRLWNSVGESFESVLEEFQQKDWEMDWEVVEISSQLYSIGEIAYVKLKTIYVVKDQEGEDMVPVPALKPTMSMEEVIAMLTEAGLDYEVDYFGADPEKRNRVRTWHESPGVLVPKQMPFWFCIENY